MSCRVRPNSRGSARASYRPAGVSCALVVRRLRSGFQATAVRCRATKSKPNNASNRSPSFALPRPMQPPRQRCLRASCRQLGGYVRNNGERPIQVLTRRDATDEMRMVVPVIACAIPIELQIDSDVSAFTTDDRIVVSFGILRAAHTDAPLALVVGHELAHANLGHLNKRRANAIIGWIGGAAADASIMLGGMSTRGAFSSVLSRAGARRLQRRVRARGRLCRCLLYRPCRLRSYSGATFHSN